MNDQTDPKSNSIPAMEETPPIPLSHLEHDLRLIQRYTFVHSSAPFTSNVPIVGPLIIALKRFARYLLRGLLSATVGTQDEFNAAVAEILFEFTRRAAGPEPLALHGTALDEIVDRLETGDGSSTVDASFAREIRLLQAQVRAAQITASENERAIADLRREIERIKTA